MTFRIFYISVHIFNESDCMQWWKRRPSSFQLENQLKFLKIQNLFNECEIKWNVDLQLHCNWSPNLCYWSEHRKQNNVTSNTEEKFGSAPKGLVVFSKCRCVQAEIKIFSPPLLSLSISSVHGNNKNSFPITTNQASSLVYNLKCPSQRNGSNSKNIFRPKRTNLSDSNSERVKNKSEKCEKTFV